MGFYSWITSDSQKSIRNSYAKRARGTVAKGYLLTPDDQPIRFEEYHGYGDIAGQNVHVLLAKWNLTAKQMEGLDEESLRLIGIDLGYSGSTVLNGKKIKCRFPLKFVEKVAPYAEVEPSQSCRFQGYFY